MLIKRTHQSKTEIVGESPSERSAIVKADRFYRMDLLHSVAVVECDTKTDLYNQVYKRERRCIHSNVQYTLTTTGIEPVCQSCGLVMLTNRVEVCVDEEE